MGTFADTITTSEVVQNDSSSISSDGAVHQEGGATPVVDSGAGEGTGTAKVEGVGVSHWAGDMAGFADTKGFTSITDALKYAESLESKLGEGQVFLPKTPEEEAEFYKLLGRPETADGYDFGADAPLSKALAPKMLELGLTDKQAKELTTGFMQLQEANTKAEQDKFTAASEQTVKEMQREMGKGYDVLALNARIAAQTFGVTPEQFVIMEFALGTRKAIEFFGQVGDRIKEGSVDKPTNEGGTPSPAAATYQIKQLMSDKAFTRAYSNPKDAGHKAAKARIQALWAARDAGE